MAKPQYNYEHQKARRDALALFVDGTRCPFCRKPMRVWQSLDLDHRTPVVHGGSAGPTRLAHSYCNRKAGGLIGNRSAKRRVRNGRAVRIGRTPDKNSSHIKGGNPPTKGTRTLPQW